MRPTVVLRLAVAVLVTAAVTVGVPVAPASAAACPSAAGVTVVVDFNQLGGGVEQVCDAGGGGDTAASLFSANGFPLTYAARQPGFVCRVRGVPASDPCVNTSPSDAYWSLYWSNGTSGRWAYSSTSAGSLRIPEGGYVAFSWKQGSAAAPPSATPTAHAAPPPADDPTPEDEGDRDGDDSDVRGSSDPSPSAPPTSATPSPSDSATPTTKPKSANPTKKDGPKATTSASGSPSPTDGPSDELSDEPSDEPSDEASDDPSDDAEVVPTASPTDPDDGLPGWVAPGLIAVLFAAAVATVLVRRRGAAGQ